MPKFETSSEYPTTEDREFAILLRGLIALSDKGKSAHCRRCQMKHARQQAETPCTTVCAGKMIYQRSVSIGMSRKAGNTTRVITYLNIHHRDDYIYLGPNANIAAKYRDAGATRVGSWSDSTIELGNVSVIVVDPQAHLKGVCKANLFDKINKMDTQPIIILIGT